MVIEDFFTFWNSLKSLKIQNTPYRLKGLVKIEESENAGYVGIYPQEHRTPSLRLQREILSIHLPGY